MSPEPDNALALRTEAPSALFSAREKRSGGRVVLICQICSVKFYVKPYRARNGTARFCSKSCCAKAVFGTPKSIEARLT